MSTVAILPARGGSVRLPRKNIRPFFGKPVLAETISLARACGLFDEVVVSTDDDQIAGVAHAWYARVWKRPTDDGTRGTQEVAAEVLTRYPSAEHACVIYPTAALTTVEDLCEGFAALQMEETAFAIAVGAEPLRDAGAFYWGHASAFGIYPLISEQTRMVVLPEDRICDVNTLADWLELERKFAKLYHKEGPPL